jgi:hypothetical protein
MNARYVTDAQISQVLRAHLPARAQAGLPTRIFEAIENTPQQRALPSFLGNLSDADPTGRRRSLLIAAAILIAVALASAAAVGALHLFPPEPVPELSLEPPADIPAFVLSSYERMPQLPPVAMTWVDSEGPKGRIYVHRSGAVRFDRYASVDATEPTSSTILSDRHLSGMAVIGPDKVWVEQQDEAFGEDARVFIHAEIGSGTISFEEAGCETTRDPSETGNGTAASGWRYVGVEYVAGRAAHHVACGGDLWLDIETRVILRAGVPQRDDAGRSIPGAFRTIEVTEIEFGEQPDALFEPPAGVAHMQIEAYYEYLCSHEPVSRYEVVGWAREGCSEPRPPEATPLPTSIPKASVRPSSSGPAGPLAWSEARLHEDWPAPVRPEPVEEAIVLPFDSGSVDSVPDPLGDTGSDVHPWVDIHPLSRYGRACLLLVVAVPPLVDPSEQWIAYGLVADDDGDGVADRRLGIDNIPVPATGEQQHRAWITDLHTGRAESKVGPGYGYVGETYFGTSFLFGGDDHSARLCLGADVAGGGTMGGLPHRFYTWASVIQDGRVVATDYAPDVGWLDPSLKGKP